MKKKTDLHTGTIMRRLSALCALACLAWFLNWVACVHAQVSTASRPNFLIVVADDMGWSDMGSFGGEINTPSLDALAGQGLSMTQFYVAPTCSPTRAMLLTGIDNHPAGVGTMHELQAPNQRNSVNYGAQLHDGVVTVAEVLQGQGYETFMTGKWHLSVDEEQRPHRRGFNRSFVLIQGGASHFGDALPVHQDHPVEYLEDGKVVGLPDDFYSSIFYTDKMLEYLQRRDTNAPFFAYLAYTAPHDPLQVPDEWLNRYKGAYDAGPVEMRKRRARRLSERARIPEGTRLWEPPVFPTWLPLYNPEWSQRSEMERALNARPMEIYASMVELLDQQIGRVISHLEQSGELKNTYVIFFSDNGASAVTPLMYPHTTREWFLTERDNRAENMGRPGSHNYLGSEWASVANSPWKLYKGTVGEGGIRSPLIVAGPGIPANRITDRIGHVMDITPSLFSIVGIEPEQLAAYAGKALPQGESLLPVWHEEGPPSPRTLALELFGNKAVRSNKWKAHLIGLPLGSGEWELFDQGLDPGETKNVASEHPEVLRELVAYYERYAKVNGVIDPEPPPIPALEKFYTGECDWWCRLKFYAVGLLVKLR